MPDLNGLSAPRLFRCTLSLDAAKAAVSVRIHVDASGEVCFAFEPVPLTNESRFLLNAWNDSSSRPRRFQLSGNDDEGIQFETDRFHVNGANLRSDESSADIALSGSCLMGEFRPA